MTCQGGCASACVQPRKTYEWLMYLGFEVRAPAGLRISRPRRQERRDPQGGAAASPLRSVFQVRSAWWIAGLCRRSSSVSG